jgi:hypothetical protein
MVMKVGDLGKGLVMDMLLSVVFRFLLSGVAATAGYYPSKSPEMRLVRSHKKSAPGCQGALLG